MKASSIQELADRVNGFSEEEMQTFFALLGPQTREKFALAQKLNDQEWKAVGKCFPEGARNRRKSMDLMYVLIKTDFGEEVGYMVLCVIVSMVHNLNLIVDDDLVCHWPFYGSYSLEDRQEGLNPNCPPGFFAGERGKDCIEFSTDEIQQLVIGEKRQDRQLVDARMNGDFTICAWICPTKASDGPIFNWEQSGQWEAHFWLISGDKLFARINGLNGHPWVEAINSPDSLPYNKWAHVACSFERSSGNRRMCTTRLFVNGVMVKERADQKNYLPGCFGKIVVGRRGNRGLNCKMRDLMLFNECKGEAEIKTIMKRTETIIQNL